MANYYLYYNRQGRIFDFMIRSMTGYGRARRVYEGTEITVEMKSVNNRYCEINVRMPRGYMQFEEAVKSCLKKQIVRGKVEVNISIIEEAADAQQIKLNEEMLKRYLEIFKEANEKFGIRNDVSATSLVRLPDVITSAQSEPDAEMGEKLIPVVEEALAAFVAQREKEGVFLVNDIITKCDTITSIVKTIEDKTDELVTAYVEKLKQRIAHLLGYVAVDEQRLLTEVAIMADRLAIDEEIVRLASHTEKLRGIFAEGLAANENAVPSGKKTDFIIQEMNREINTVTSKIGDMEITNSAIEIKTLIEKVREQLQNIE